MKRSAIWSIVIACILLVVSPFQAAAASPKVKIVVNDEALKLDVDPYMKDNRVLVPVRGVFENIGLNVNWNASTKTATIKNEETSINMKLGKKDVQVNGKTVKVDSAVAMKNNRLFIPIRFVIENSGAQVNWNQAQKTVYVTSGLSPAAKAFLSKLSQVEMNSFTADMKVQQSMTYLGEKMTMDMDMKMDMVLDPIGLYQFMSMTMKEFGEENVTTESYLTKDGYYSFDPMFNKWVKYDDEMAKEMLSLSDYQMSPTERFELIQRYYKNVKIIENAGTYELHASLSGKGFQDLIDEMLNLSGLGVEEDIFNGMEIIINKMNIVSIIDKKTLYPISDTMDSDMTISAEGEKMNIKQKANNTYSNVNKLEKITIPQHVIDTAVPFEELYGEE
ncbi:copper amine oxidase N-terminal domain-containing protein [Bacillus sp. ISL-47]|uniref:copper amine oxidase N-terminal domain-containing protein n=1 Tax=Bacillus sp. ISL-47 TaxID=2819130 RepID=UPI001BE70C55|nr:copper amine oxidase N-terminal domain-containing protein [Bacillus sp. ISL-47]MBT2687391.1 copper amine oxidase N-terminal domain-containing protein [Bacillus sp. ISL-47]MBT2707147.1 copper amine oxidase N-terminal domain-containing protein [Pseudomonas sp. ISL-84]